MPSPSAARHRGSIIRQLSLQGQTSTQPPAGRRGLRKQLTEDDGRSRTLDSVEITGQGWPVNNEKPEAGLRAGSNDGSKCGQLKTVTAPRPRPVKLAWGDRKQDSTECPTGVEVVARKCQGQPRPLTVKPQRITNLPLLGDKDSLVYTRQQLAERLRIAWREREKSKPNLNIFLAHAAETARSGNEETNTGRSSGIPQAEILIQDSVSFRSVSTSDGSILSGAGTTYGTEPTRVLPRDTIPGEHVVKFTTEKIGTVRNNCEFERKSILKNVTGHAKRADSKAVTEQPEPENVSERDVSCSVTDCLDFQTFPVSELPNTFGNNLTNINYQMKNLDVVSKTCAGSAAERLTKDKENFENNSPRSDSGYSENSKIGNLDDEVPCKMLDVCEDNDVRPHITAQERRASFRSGSVLNKAIDESCTPPGTNSSEEADDDVPVESSNGIKVFLRKNDEKRPPLTRTFSAPTRNETQSPKPMSGPGNGKLNAGCKALQHCTSSVDLAGIDEDLNALRGRIKSAPIRRKLKTAAARRKHRGKEPDSSDDEKQSSDSSKKRTSRRKATSRMSANDIVTMVSLVSPATSDAEETVMPLPEETWTAQEKEEKPEECAEKTSTEAPKEISSFIIQKFVSLRKTNKTVSFVQHPPINRSYSASFPSRRAPAGTPIIIPPPVIINPALTPAQLQEREKRPQPPSSGVTAGADSRGIKRRLIRTASAPQVKECLSRNFSRSQCEIDLPMYPEFPQGKGSTSNWRHRGNPVNRSGSNDCTKDPTAKVESFEDLPRKDFGKIEESNEEKEEDKKEPEFKTPKEKECWMLYQKMLEKGVSVSFDTVLRGMLTPTEYRLRRNQLLSTC